MMPIKKSSIPSCLLVTKDADEQPVFLKQHRAGFGMIYPVHVFSGFAELTADITLRLTCG